MDKTVFTANLNNIRSTLDLSREKDIAISPVLEQIEKLGTFLEQAGEAVIDEDYKKFVTIYQVFKALLRKGTEEQKKTFLASYQSIEKELHEKYKIATVTPIGEEVQNLSDIRSEEPKDDIDLPEQRKQKEPVNPDDKLAPEVISRTIRVMDENVDFYKLAWVLTVRDISGYEDKMAELSHLGDDMEKLYANASMLLTEMLNDKNGIKRSKFDPIYKGMGEVIRRAYLLLKKVSEPNFDIELEGTKELMKKVNDSIVDYIVKQYHY